MLIYRPGGSWRRGCTDGQGMSGSRAPRISGRHESIREGGGASIRCVSDARPPWKRCRMEAEGAGKTGWPGAQVGRRKQSDRALPRCSRWTGAAALLGATSGQGFRRAPPEDMGGQGGLNIRAEQGDNWTFCQCSWWRPRLLDETTATMVMHGRFSGRTYVWVSWSRRGGNIRARPSHSGKQKSREDPSVGNGVGGFGADVLMAILAGGDGGLKGYIESGGRAREGRGIAI